MAGASAPTSLQAAASPAATATLGQQAGAPNSLQFHGDAARSGFNRNETVLTPSNVASSFGQVWQSPVLDGRVYATPLFEDGVTISGNGNAANHSGDGVQSAAFQNKTLGVVFAATGGGSVYAVAAQDTNGTTGIAPGTILWKTHLGNAYAGVDGNSIGVLGTPIIDAKSGRLYVVASVTDYLTAANNPNHGGNNFEVFALNVRDGSLVGGFPLVFTQALLDSINQNTLASGTGAKVAVAFSPSGADQRGALSLSADGSTLYVDFACYGASNPGWMTTVATGITNGAANGQTPAVVSAYSSIDTTAVVANGGMWGAGGPSVDASGNVFVSTGDSPSGTGNPVGTWGNSVLEFGPGQTLSLTGVYTPWNYQTQDTIDSDLGGGSPILINLPAGSSTTPELLATGGKQGNGYLLDAGNNLNNPTPNANGSPASYPADLTRRPPVVTANQDPGLYDTSAAGVRSYFTPAQNGPLALFGPYNESSASGNTAKARDTPDTFVGPDGTNYVIWAGASKSAVGSSTPVAPSLYLTKVNATPGQPAYLSVVTANTAVMSNPGAGLVTGNGTANEIQWIVDAGVQRTDSLSNFSNGAPILYAYNALTLQPLWSSGFEQLDMGGKYNSVAVARGNVFVGTDRIQAFGLTADTITDDAVTGTGPNQFTYSGSGWSHVTGSPTMATFDGTVSTDNQQGDFATLTFTGSSVTVYADEKSGYGTATISVDGANTQSVALTPATSSPNGQGNGDVAVYTVGGLGAGTHTLKILNNAASNTISVDRVEVAPLASAPAKPGVSLTDGGAVPSAGGVIPYTINYNNAGSVLANTGTAASGVVLTETVPANTTADLANSTPGWTLASAGPGGAGSAGSTYTFAVGALGAGVTGSAVFSLDLNGSIPAGTTSVTDTVTISDTAGDTASGSRTTAIPPPAETKLIFSQQPPATGSAGIALSPPVTVAAQDQFGNTYTADSASTVTLTLNGGTFAGGSNTATAPVVNGVATFNNLVISSAGSYTLTATDGALASANSAPFTIAATSKLAFTQQPTQATAGAAVSPAVKVAVEDQAGNVITTDASTVTLTINHGGFANGSTTATAAAVNGVATFSNLVINATGSYTLVATDGNLASAQSNSFNVVAQGSKLAFTQQPNNTNAGEAVNPSVTVAVEDALGNVATGDASTVTVTLAGTGGATGTFFGGATTATAAAVNGVATFNNLVVTAPGTYTLTATDSGLAGAASYSFTVGSRALTSIDDNNANNTGATPQVVYSAPTSRWVQSATSLPGNFDGTVTTDATGGDTTSVTFTGTLVTLYAAVGPGAGSAQIFIDGNSPAQVSLSAAASAVAPVFTSGLLTAGTHTVQVKVVSGNVSIDRFVVGPATPVLAWATPADLNYGTALDGTQLDAFETSSPRVDGTFAYSPPAGTVLPVGQGQKLSVTFTPTDAADYNTASAAVTINVNKVTPTITWNEPPAMTYGQTLGPGQLDATATLNGNPVPGTFTYSPPAGTVPRAGADFPLGVTFTPDDPTTYNVATAGTNVDVSPATPVVTWPAPADINDGTPLGAAQLDATANVPGTFAYTPAAGAILPAGPHQSLGVLFTPSDSVDYTPASATTFINVNYGPAAKLAFLQQPTGAKTGATINPPVTVAVQDSAGSTIPSDASTVTLTLSAGATFASTGTNTVTAAAVNGVATFNNLAINTSGTYSLTATDGALTSATSNPFRIGSTVSLNFNTAATDFTGNFTVYNNGGANATSLNWNATAGIDDQDNTTPGGGVASTGSAAVDSTAVFTPFTVDLSDGAVHTVSQFITQPAGVGTGDKPLQVGFLSPGTTGFNGTGGFSFVSARILGGNHAEFQSCNNGNTGQQGTTSFTGAVAAGDWLQLVFTTQETAPGSFKGTFAVVDYGPTGVGVGRTVLAPVSYSATGLTGLGAATAVSPGFRTATAGGFTGPLGLDDFAVDATSPPVKFGFIQQAGTGTAGAPLSPSPVLALQDANGQTVTGDTSTVTLALSHDTFADGTTSVSVNAVGGVATFGNLVINTPGSYVLRATDTSGAVDPAFDPITIVGPSKLAFTQQPTNGTTGAPITPAVAVAVQDASGNTVPADASTVTLTLSGGATFASTGTNTVTAAAVNGVATFTNLAVSSDGTYTLAATDGALTAATSNPFTVVGPASQLVFTQNPTNGTIFNPLNPAVAVTLQDAQGVTSVGNSSTVTLTLSGGATFASTGTNTVTAAAVNGVATFNNLVINTPGTHTLTATDGGLAAATSNAFAVAQPSSMTLDDVLNAGSGTNQIRYSGTNVSVNNPTSIPGAIDGTCTNLNNTGDTAAITFTGTQIKFYSAEKNTRGIAAVSLDGGAATNVDTYVSSTNGTGDVLVYTSPLLKYGTHTLTVKNTGTKNASSSGTIVSIDAFQVADVLPTVTSVQVAGTGWSSAFSQYLTTNGLGGANGFSLGGPNQPFTLPWNNVNQLSIGFNEDVNVSVASLYLAGASGTTYSGAGVSSFTYDATAHVATWTFANPLPADKLTLGLSSSVTDKTANALDGTYIDGNSLPSGIGVAGKAFVMHLNALPGDAITNGFIQANDVLTARSAQSTNSASAGYSAFADVDGNGFIQANDVLFIRSLLSTSLPLASAPAAPANF